MTEDSSEVLRQEPTDVRYGTRSLLIAMAVVAVSITALGGFVRSFPEDVQPRLVVHWAILFVLLGAGVAYNARRRYVAEKQAGVVRFRLMPHSYFILRLPSIGRAILGMLLLLAAPAAWVVTSIFVAERAGNLWLQLLNWQTYLVAAASTMGMSYLWWHRTVRVCDLGLVIRHKCVLWKDCRRWYWDAMYRDVVVVEFNQNEKISFKVPSDVRAAVEAFVNGRTFRIPSEKLRIRP